MTTTPPDARNALAEIVAGSEPAAWMHPSAGWTNKSFDAVRVHCRDDGPMPEPLYSAAQVAALKMRGDNHWETLRSIREFARIGDFERIIQWVNDAGSGYVQPDEKTMGEMMDRIAALEAQVEGMRVALEPFALTAERDIGDDETDNDRFTVMVTHNRAPRLMVGDFRRARAALQSSETTGEK